MQHKATMWVESFQNHIIYCSVYVAVFVTCCKNGVGKNHSKDDAAVGDWLTVSTLAATVLNWNFLLGFLAFRALIAEIRFVLKRWKLPPGDSGYPMVGSFFQLLKDPKIFFSTRKKKYGSPGTHNMLMTPCINFSKDDDVLWMLTQERKGYLIPVAMPHLVNLVGREAIMMQHATKHKTLRRAFEPAFSPQTIRSYVPIMDETVQTKLETWCKKPSTDKSSSTSTTVSSDSANGADGFCSPQEWSLLAMKLFFVCAFGQIDESLLVTLNGLFETWYAGFATPLPFNIPGTSLAKAHAAKKELAAVLQGMVKDFKSRHPPGSPGAENKMMGRLCYTVDENSEPLLTDEQLITNIHFILFAGHDTTKGSFCSFVHYLVKFPKVHQLLAEEVAKFSEPLDIDELKQAPILNAFLAESWRLMPPLATHTTTTTRDLYYKDYIIRKGSKVQMSIQTYNIENFQHGEEFKLERWLPKDHPLYDPKYSIKDDIDYNVMSVKYRSFNAGAHICLGSHFAKLEARIVMARLVQQYNIEIRNETMKKFPMRQRISEFRLTPKKTPGSTS